MNSIKPAAGYLQKRVLRPADYDRSGYPGLDGAEAALRTVPLCVERPGKVRMSPTHQGPDWWLSPRMAKKCHHFLLSDLSDVTAYKGVIIPSV